MYVIHIRKGVLEYMYITNTCTYKVLYYIILEQCYSVVMCL